MEEALAETKHAVEAGEIAECQALAGKLAKISRMLSDAILFGVKPKEKS